MKGFKNGFTEYSLERTALHVFSYNVFGPVESKVCMANQLNVQGWML